MEKWKKNWTGPYNIVHLVGKSADLQSPTAFFPKVNTDQLRIFIEEQPIIPQNITKTEKPASTLPPAEESASTPPPAEEPASTPPPAEEPVSTLLGVEAERDTAVPPFSGSTKVEKCIVRLSHPKTLILYCFILDIRKAWDGTTSAVILSKIGPYKLFYVDIFRTAPGRELESEVKRIVFLSTI